MRYPSEPGVERMAFILHSFPTSDSEEDALFV